MVDTDNTFIDDDGRKLRSSIRLKARGKAELRPGLSGTNPNIALELINVSERGALVKTSSPLQAGRSTELKLFGPENRTPVVRTAEVVRCDPAQDGLTYYLGLKFKDPLKGPELNSVSTIRSV